MGCGLRTARRRRASSSRGRTTRRRSGRSCAGSSRGTAYDKSRRPRVAEVANDGASLAGVEQSASLTWIGHASFAIHDADDVLLTDPHFGKRALIPGRLQPPGIPVEAIPDDAFAVISHNHYDHLDVDTVEALPESVHWFVPLGPGRVVPRARDRPNVTELDWWQSAQHGRWTHHLPAFAALVPGGSSRALNESLWCAWLARLRRVAATSSPGDTGYFHGFARVRPGVYPDDRRGACSRSAPTSPAGS